MNNLIIRNSQLVTVTFTGTPTAQRRYFFDDNPQISRMNIKLYGFEAFGETQLDKIADGSDVVANADLDQMLLTIKNIDNVEIIQRTPVYNLVRANVGGFITLNYPVIINLTDCYVELTDNTGVSEGEVLPFNFYYEFI